MRGTDPDGASMSCVGRGRHALPSSWQDASSRLPAAQSVRAVAKILRPRREGAGKAGCALHPRSRVQKCTKECAHEHTGSAEAIRPSLRNGFNGLFRTLPGDRAFLSPSPRENRRGPRPVGPTLPSRDLTPASRRQDHTTSPSAAVLRQSLRRAWYPSAEVRAKASLASFVSALCHRSQAKPALRHFARPTLPRPPHPAPTFVTMANAPLRSRTRGVIE